MNLCDLDEFSLSAIFSRLSCEELERCIYVCKRFHYIIKHHVYFKKSLNLLLTGHQLKAAEFNRNLYNFTYRKRLKLYENWRYGRYEEKSFFHHKVMYLSKILLEPKMFYMSHGGQIRIHERTKKGYFLKGKPICSVGNVKDPDITWFTKKDGVIFAGKGDGSAFIYDCEHQYYGEQKYLHTDTITCVDFHDDLFVTTTKSTTTRFWKKYEELGTYLLEHRYQLQDAYETIKICPNNTRMAAGKYHDRQRTALRLIDMETGKTSILNSPSTAIYHVAWKDENCILTGNFDTTFRVVDCRTQSDVATWTDPYDASVYCLDYDGAYGVLCGMKYHFRVNLYDLRMPKKVIQMYFSSKKYTSYSPVYSLAADSSQLFLVTDHDLRILNFDADWARSKDYSDIFY